jgi:hypothetical protein
LWDVEASTFSRQSSHRWRWGCQHYAPAALYPQEGSLYWFIFETESKYLFSSTVLLFWKFYTRTGTLRSRHSLCVKTSVSELHYMLKIFVRKC